jgi:hypothetical protein
MSPKSPQKAGNFSPARPDGIDGSNRIPSANNCRRQLRRRVVERIDNDRVVQPEVQAHPQDQGEYCNALQPRHHGLLDLSRKMQVTPRHDVNRRDRNHGGLENVGQPRRVVADVSRQLAVHPNPKCGEKSH